MAPFSSSNVSAVQVRRRLAVIALALGVLTLVGLIVLWPRGAAPNLRPTGVTVDYVDATVVSSEPSTCGLAQEAPQDCQKVTAHVTSGADKGDTAVFEIPTSQFNAPTLHAGDKVVLLENPGADPQFRYSFSDFQRSTPLVAASFVLFAIVVIAFGRWQGLRALAGLVASLAAILIFLLPSLLRGNPALPVVIVSCSFLIAYIALYLADGVNPNTTVALLGTLAVLYRHSWPRRAVRQPVANDRPV